MSVTFLEYFLKKKTNKEIFNLCDLPENVILSIFFNKKRNMRSKKSILKRVIFGFEAHFV